MFIYFVLAVLLVFVLFIAYNLYRTLIVRHPVVAREDKPLDSLSEPRQWYVAHSAQRHAELEQRGYQIVTIQSARKHRLQGYLFASQKGSDLFVIAFHGYRYSALEEFLYISEIYLNQDINLLLVDQEAHGKSEGKHIGFGYPDRLNALRWVNYLVEQFGSDIRIVLHGVSMGGATVLMAAGDAACPSQVKAVVDDCGYSSLVELGKNTFTMLPKPLFYGLFGLASVYCRVLAGYHFTAVNVVRFAEHISIPVLLIHGVEDALVPLRMQDEIIAALPGEHYRLQVETAGHAESYLVDAQTYTNEVNALIARIGGY